MPFDRKVRQERIAGGISVGAETGSTGTLSGIFYDLDRKSYVMLSNYHVFNGYLIFQPGKIEKGWKVEDLVGNVDKKVEFNEEKNIFKRFICYVFGIWCESEYNYLDAATARILDRCNRAFSEGVYLDDGRIIKPEGAHDGDGIIGMRAWKVGRTTGYTEGSVISDCATIRVWYGNRARLFKDVIIVAGKSEPGDSGSPVFICDGDDLNKSKFVGILFAGSNDYFVVCKYKYIKDYLRVVWPTSN